MLMHGSNFPRFARTRGYRTKCDPILHFRYSQGRVYGGYGVVFVVATFHFSVLGFCTSVRMGHRQRLRAAAAFRPGETQEWVTRQRFPGRIIIGERAGALQIANEWRRRDTIWTDG